MLYHNVVSSVTSKNNMACVCMSQKFEYVQCYKFTQYLPNKAYFTLSACFCGRSSINSFFHSELKKRNMC